MTPHEELRRLLLFTHALWEAREELSSRFHEIDLDSLDWFERERLNLAIEADRRALERHESLLFLAAYSGDSSAVRCTGEERQAAVALAIAVLEGRLSAEYATDQLVSDDFPKSDRPERGGKRR